ncbi:ABC transporter ATP-binding protein [Vibrio sp. SCSIO 43140]|uniref:ABC transporter ATP-binding protein n=1 Tax=Vibrio sp. SCSIO 43140 TaxID=2819100 RepID=UPI00207508FC|nr:dipeptide/oligopeptide/nickel ABC transporter ATP-binding protein [Vibrio sp. SCSIO 43140]USD61377.1 ABC transporter ATP-binding protein [Vibrio sp. SCSIO 43140]
MPAISSGQAVSLEQAKHTDNAATSSVLFEDVSVHHYSMPKWLGGKPFKALDKVSLKVAERSVAIVGPSGAGKSTMIEILFGLRTPQEGRIKVLGHTLPITSNKERLALCKQIQLIPQEPHTSLNPYYTVAQVLIEPLESLGIEGNHQQKAQRALEEVGLRPELLALTPSQLSTGQAQRVAIARALIVEPELLVADEPTSSLDPVNRQHLINLLNTLKQQRALKLILVTHDLGAASALCDDIVVLDQGQVVEHDCATCIMNSPTHPTTKALIHAQPLTSAANKQNTNSQTQ